MKHLEKLYRGHWKGLFAPYARIFFLSRSGQQEPSYNGLKGTKERKIFSLTIFFSETIEPRKTVLGSLERALRALHGPSYNGFKKNWAGVIGKGSSRPTGPYFFCQDLTNRSRVITHLEKPDRGHWKVLIAPYTPMFFLSRSDQQEPSYNEKRDRGHWKVLFAPYTPIFSLIRSDQQEPSYNGLKGTKERKIFSLTIFFSEIIAPKKTVPGTLERNKGKKIFSLTIFISETIAPRKTGLGHLKGIFVPYTPIFFWGRVITKNRTGVVGKGSSRPTRPYFFCQDLTNRGRVITNNCTWDIGKGSSRPTHAYFFYQDLTNRSLVMKHLEKLYRGHWKGLFVPYARIFFLSRSGQQEPTYNDLTNRSRVITHLEKLYRGHWKGLFAPYTGIFFLSRSGQQEPSYNEPRKTVLGSLERALRALHKNWAGVIGKGSSRPTGPYFFCQDLTNRSRVITHLEKPDRGHWKVLIAPYTPMFFLSRSDQQEPSYNEKRDRGHWKVLFAPYTPIFSLIRSDQQEPSYNGLKGTKERKIFSLTIFFSEIIAPKKTVPGTLEKTIAPRKTVLGSLERALRVLHYLENRTGVIGKCSSRPIRPYFFYQDLTNRSRVITKNQTRVIGKRSSRPTRPYFFYQDLTNRGRVITKNRTGVVGKGSSRPTRPYFFCQDLTNRGRVITNNCTWDIGKGSSRPTHAYFFYQDLTNRSLVMKHLEKLYRGHWKGLFVPYARIFFLSRSGQQEPTYNDLTNRSRVITHLEKLYRGHWKGLFAPYTGIFFLSRSGQQEPSYNEPRKTVLGSLERALRALHKNWAGVIGKGSSRPTGPYFFCQDLTNRSRVITHLEKPDRGHWKVLIAPYTPMFFLSRSDQQEPSYNEKRDRGHWKVLFAPYTPIFSLIRSDQQEPSYNGLKGTKERKIFSLTIFFSEIIAPKKTVPGTLEKTIAPRKTVLGSDQQEPSYNGLNGTKGRKIFSITIFFAETIVPRKPDRGHWKKNQTRVIGKRSSRPTRPYFFYQDLTNRGRVITKNRTGVVGKGSSRPTRPYFFCQDLTNRGRVITNNCTWDIGKGSSRPTHAYFFYQDLTNRSLVMKHLEKLYRGHWKGLFVPYARIFFLSRSGQQEPTHNDLTNRSRVITHLEKLYREHWKGLFAPYTGIFFLSRSGQQEPSYNGLKGTKERKIFSLTIFSSETIEPRKTVLGCDQQEPSYNGLKGTKERKIFFLTIFFAETIAPRKTGPGSLETIFFAETIAPRKTGPGSLENLTNRSRVITKNQTRVIGKRSSRPTRPYFFYQDLTNRGRVITHLEKLYWGHWKGLFASYMSIFFLLRSDQQEPSYNGLNGTKERKIFSITIFFAETIEPSYNGLKGTKERKIFSLTIFISETIAPRKTGLGHLKGIFAPYTPIFFWGRVITKNRTGVVGKGSSRPTRPYFFCQDLTNRGRVITKNCTWDIGKGSSRPTHAYFFYQDLTNRSLVMKHLEKLYRGHWKGLFVPYARIFFLSRSGQQEPTYNGLKGTKERKIFFLTIFFAETIVPRKTGPGSLENLTNRSRVITKPSYEDLKGTKKKKFYLTIFFSETIAPRKTVPGTLERALRALHRHIFFYQDLANRSRVITHLEEPDRGHWKVLIAPYTPISFLSGSGQQEPSYNDLTNRSRVITHLEKRDRGHWKVLFAPYTPIFSLIRSDEQEPSYNGLKGTKERKIFSLTIFFSEIIAPRKTKPSYEDLKGTKKKKFYLTIFFSETIAPRKTAPGTLERALRALHNLANRSRVITNLEKLFWGHWKGLFAPYTSIFFLLRSDQQEPSYNGLKGTKERKIFFLTIFFAETIAPRKTGPWSLENLTNRSRVITHLEEPDRGHWKVLFAPYTPISSLSRSGQQEPSYNGLKGTKERKIFSLTIFFAETIEPRKTGPGSDQQEPSYNGLNGTKERKIFSITIFFAETIVPRKTGPGSLENLTNRSRVITGPSYNDLKGTKERKIFSLTIFFSETIAPRKTVPGTLERALRALHTHNLTNRSLVMKKNLTRVIGKGSSRPTRPYFFYQDLTNRGRVITQPEEPDRGRLKGLSAPYTPIFFCQNLTNRSRVKTHPEKPDRKNWTGVIGKGSSRPTRPYFFCQDLTNRSRVITKKRTGVIGKGSSRPTRPYFFYQDLTNRSRVITYLGKPDRSHWKVLFAPYTPIFFYQDLTNRSRVITYPSYKGLKATKERKIFFLTIFFSGTIAPRKTGPGSLQSAHRALYAHHPGEPDRGRLKGLSAPYTPIFFCQNLTNRSRVKTHPEKPDRKNWTGVIGKGSSRPTRPYFFCQDLTNRSRVITKKRTGVIGKGSSRPTRPYFFYQDLTNRSRVITHLEKLYWGHWKGLFASYISIFFLLRSDQQEPSYNGLNGTKERKIFSITIFFAETIEPSYNGLKGTKERKIFSLTIFISETIAPRKTGLGHLKGLFAPYTPIFFWSRSDQ
ncbi:hypothetical protein V1477_000088 [Vespula maculifrons]|uniref:Protein TIC 214 n=1 Tax=Vespula maculifrons TaxID=7453 RepID=A0ABD2D2J2_VESMC